MPDSHSEENQDNPPTFLELLFLLSTGAAFPITSSQTDSELLEHIFLQPNSNWFQNKNPILPG